MSYFVGITSLSKRPFGGLSVEQDITISGEHENVYSDFLYRYNYESLVGEEAYDILKVIEIINEVTVYRYFLVRRNGRALALVKRVIDPSSEPKNQAYVYSTSMLLSKGYFRRVFPLKAAWGYEELKGSLGEVFTPILFTEKDRDSPSVVNNILNNKNKLGWLDLVTVQGWFSVKTITSLDFTPPPHAGWELEGAFITEVSVEMDKPVSLDVEKAFKENYVNYGNVYNSLFSKMSESISKWIACCNLADFKATLSLRRDNDYTDKYFYIDSYFYYDPFNGCVNDVESLEREDCQNACAVVNNISDTIMSALFSASIPIDSIRNITIYRQINDLVYIFFNTDSDKDNGRIVLDFSKHLLVHYGFVDLPMEQKNLFQ